MDNINWQKNENFNMVGSRILESDNMNVFCLLFSRSQSLFSGVKIVIAHQLEYKKSTNKNIT
jgi:hypothetical protein